MYDENIIKSRRIVYFLCQGRWTTEIYQGTARTCSDRLSFSSYLFILIDNIKRWRLEITFTQWRTRTYDLFFKGNGDVLQLDADAMAGGGGDSSLKQ